MRLSALAALVLAAALSRPAAAGMCDMLPDIAWQAAHERNMGQGPDRLLRTAEQIEARGNPQFAAVLRAMVTDLWGNRAITPEEAAHLTRPCGWRHLWAVPMPRRG